MQINVSTKQGKRPRGRPKKAKLVQTPVLSEGRSTDKSFFSYGSTEKIKVKTATVISKNESPNKSYKNNEQWTKRKCLCCSKIFDSWGIGNRLCKSCK